MSTKKKGIILKTKENIAILNIQSFLGNLFTLSNPKKTIIPSPVKNNLFYRV